jgi:hypothetical protein
MSQSTVPGEETRGLHSARHGGGNWAVRVASADRRQGCSHDTYKCGALREANKNRRHLFEAIGTHFLFILQTLPSHSFIHYIVFLHRVFLPCFLLLIDF